MVGSPKPSVKRVLEIPFGAGWVSAVGDPPGYSLFNGRFDYSATVLWELAGFFGDLGGLHQGHGTFGTEPLALPSQRIHCPWNLYWRVHRRIQGFPVGDRSP